jgi:hypothetical protein
MAPEIQAGARIARVEYQLDGQTVYRATSETPPPGSTQPWAWAWDTRQLPPGMHQLAITAYDENGAASPPYVLSLQVAPPSGTADWRLLIIIAAGVLLLIALIIILILSGRQRAATTPVSPDDMPPVARSPAGAPPPPPTAPGPSSQPPTLASISGGRPPFAAPPPAPSTFRMDMGAGAWGEGGAASGPKTEILRRQPITMAWLIMQAGPQVGREFRLGELTTIGRTGDNDIVLDDTSVSRRHAVVRLNDMQFFIQDVGATNPTRVNDQEMVRCQLADGDRVEIGRIVLVFKQIQPAPSRE